ncbi:MAG: protein kinase [Polyangiaceae bacterium]|nr:protein kinase [Polyangiaceae bacterium]
MTQRHTREDDTIAAPSGSSGAPEPIGAGSGAHGAARHPSTFPTGEIPPCGGGEARCKRQVLAGRYELLCLIGVGGMGNVYRARDVELDETVALKALRIDRAVELARPVCAGLAAAHQAGVIHRDLKPDNVLVARSGRVALTDFGIARAFARGDGAQTLGVTLGTPAYMAPEQVEGREDIDGRADIYALGAMLYEMFTGERAWVGDGPFAVAAARLLVDPPDPRRRRPDLPDAFARLILRCMARSRDDRFATADLVAAELSSLTQPAIRSLSVRPPPEAPVSAALPSSHPGDKIVAVLPFRNQGPPDDEYLADELTDDLIDNLSMTRGLKVRPRGVVARFKGAEQDPRDIGRELGVQVILGGSVRRRAGAVRINARLLSVADGFQLWARHIERPEAEVLRLNDEVAQAVVEALTLDAGAAAPARDVPSDPVALDLFLRARHEYRQFWPKNLRRAIELVTQAEARAPGDPMLLALEALARSRLWFFAGEGGEEAIQAAERAIAAAPDLADARLALASARIQAGETEAAMRELRRAIARSPGLAEAQAMLGVILLEIGEIEEGRRRVEAALALDPEVPLAKTSLARTLELTGRSAEADALAGPAILDGRFVGSALHMRFLLWRRDVATARTCLPLLKGEEGYELSSAMLRLMVHAEVPETLEFMQIERLSRAAVRRRAFVKQLQAEVYAFLGRAEAVVRALAGSVEEGLIDLLWLERCPLLAEAREDPRFGPLHAEVRRRADGILRAFREG